MSTPLATVVLTVASGADAGRKIQITAGQRLQIGRGADADLAISDDPSLSRLHFALQHSGGAVVVEDLGSRNGTLVNGVRVARRTLADGDTIVAGDTRFGVSLVAAPLEPARVQAPAAMPLRPAAPPPPQTQAAKPEGVTRDWEAGLADEDPAVREEVLRAAAWTRQPWLLDHLRRRAAKPAPEHWPELWMLAVLGGPEDLPLIRMAAEEESLGPRRLALVGVYAHAELVDLLLREMEAADPMTAHEARRAFERITGFQDRSLDSGGPADQWNAHQYWRELMKTHTPSHRLFRGSPFEAAQALAAQVDFDSMDAFATCRRWSARR